MLTVAEAQQKLAGLYGRRFDRWAVDGAPATAADIPLRPPTETTALREPQRVSSWIAEWGEVHQKLVSGSAVVWETRRWPNAGTNTMATRLVLQRPEDLAAFIRQGAHWSASCRRAQQLREVVEKHAAEAGAEAEPVRDALRRSLKDIVALPQPHYERLLDVVDWLIRHPESDVFPRQLPVRGVDTKWLESHRKIVGTLVSSLTGDASLGLRPLPARLRIRVLDPALAPGGLRDISAPVAELVRWETRPRCAVVVENLQTLLGLPDMPGVIGIHNPGSTGAPLLAELGWLRGVGLIYWGDLDVEGLRILSRVRSRFPQTRSVLTDRDTLESHLDLTVPDHERASRTMPEHLTPEERELFLALEEHGRVRLEQERIPWDRALAALHDAVTP
ncbi:Wadjet anti-phage system protein JetD domain-containing protein [Nesterenkonia cremea]|uniref:DUF3322 and DUF2220 domain-containing protein n=1 Tax=Nesterenkonia cremea TaxID=1882340 RepID=A0A917ESP1_9MICC|nr:Wadjet anti-phage system protein JetD domain-containing protein [Nesterenkonia cremea]GGE74960.1 hypothetical protein GCM10011401_22740 [Nesterenkonia cremea]